jgi:hypothetical protein
MHMSTGSDNTSQKKPLVRRLGALLRRHGLMLISYLILAIIFTYPMIGSFSTAIGGEQDALENYWNLWWTGLAVFDWRHNPFDSTIMYYPFGLPLFFHTYNPLNAFLSLPLQAVFNTAIAYNLLVLFAFVMAGVGAYSLVYYLTEQRSAAFVAGLIFAFSPYMEFHLRVGQPFMLSVQWLPLYLLFLLRGLRDHWRYLPLAAFFLILVGYTDWHYTSYALVITAIVAFYELLRVMFESRAQADSPAAWRPLLGRAWGGVIAKFAAVGLMFAVGISPVLVPMMLELQRQPYAVRPIYHSILHSTDLLAFFIPSIYHPLWGEWASEIFYSLVPSYITGGMATLGYGAMFLALVAVWKDRKRSLLYILMFVCFFLLALGPYLQVGGVNSSDTATPIAMPYYYFNKLPFMNIQRIPSRFVAVVMLALAVLVGFGVSALSKLPRIQALSANGQKLAYGALVGLLLFEYWPNAIPLTPIDDQQVSAFYRQLAQDPDEYPILEIPYKGVPSMFYQTHHGKITVGGRIAREVSHPWSRARFFGAMIRGEEPNLDIGPDSSQAAQLQALACQNIRYVVFYKQRLEPQQKKGSAALEPLLFSEATPIYEDEILRAYEVPPSSDLTPYWTPSKADWYEPEIDANGLVSRWMQDDQGTILLYPCTAMSEPSSALLRFKAYSYGQDRSIEVLVNGVSAGQFSLPLGQLRSFQVTVPLQAGENSVTFRSLEPATATNDPNDPRSLSVNISQASVELIHDQ